MLFLPKIHQDNKMFQQTVIILIVAKRDDFSNNQLIRMRTKANNAVKQITKDQKKVLIKIMTNKEDFQDKLISSMTKTTKTNDKVSKTVVR